MAVLFGVLIAVCYVKAAVGISCEDGKAVNKIADVLTDVSDWEGLGNELNAKRGTLDGIKTACRADASSLARCYRRELVHWYCDSTGYELGVIVENIAKALEELGNKRQAANLRALEFNGAKNTGDQPSKPTVPRGSSTQSSPPHVLRESNIPPSEHEQPAQSGGDDGRPKLSLATSVREYLMAFSTGEIVFGVLSVLVIGLLISSRYQRKGSNKPKKDRSSPPPTPPPESPYPKEKRSAATSGARKTTVPSPTDPMTEPIFDERVTLVRLGFLEYGGKELRLKSELEPYWQDLAPHLGISGAEILAIKKSAQHQQDTATSAMFGKWMTKDPDHTWRNLIKAMKKIQLNALAADLAKALRHS